MVPGCLSEGRAERSKTKTAQVLARSSWGGRCNGQEYTNRAPARREPAVANVTAGSTENVPWTLFYCRSSLILVPRSLVRYVVSLEEIVSMLVAFFFRIILSLCKCVLCSFKERKEKRWNQLMRCGTFIGVCRQCPLPGPRSVRGLEVSVFRQPPTLQNRLQESLKLFASICNNMFFTDTSLVSFVLKQLFAAVFRRFGRTVARGIALPRDARDVRVNFRKNAIPL